MFEKYSGWGWSSRKVNGGVLCDRMCRLECKQNPSRAAEKREVGSGGVDAGLTRSLLATAFKQRSSLPSFR